MVESCSAEAPAKVNLVLEVLGKRADGYHEIDTILQTLALSDTVTVHIDSAGPPVSVGGPSAEGCPADETNLAWRAAAALATRTGRPLDGLAIHLEKRIPAAGGLGGGASDAAAVIRLLQARWPGVTEADAASAAAAIGSDEPALLLGGTVRARGRGEMVRPLPEIGPHGVVLFVPPATIERKTARLFAAFGGLPFDPGGRAESFATAPPRVLTTADTFNAFERVAFGIFDGLAALRDALERRLGGPVRLAGAGPVLFWVGPPDGRDEVVRRAEGAACTIIPTATAGPPWKP